ncbi:MAG: protein-tyrosine-phosphatase [Cyclobacteriaceae bacterium]
MRLSASIEELFARFTSEFDLIPNSRKQLLKKLGDYINRRAGHANVDLVFICTHNSRRSHMAQLWAQAAAWHYGMEKVRCFSGGTEATAFHPNAVNTLRSLGFVIEQKTQHPNPIYQVEFGEGMALESIFSKSYDHPSNPSSQFAAVMTCAHADANCPVVVGCDMRIALPYDDPKDYDGTGREAEAYRNTALLIGRELAYAMASVKS